MKAAADHKVPPSAAVLYTLTTLKLDTPLPVEIVFAGQRGGILSDMALSQLLKRMGRPDITVHGFCSTFRD